MHEPSPNELVSRNLRGNLVVVKAVGEPKGRDLERAPNERLNGSGYSPTGRRHEWKSAATGEIGPKDAVERLITHHTSRESLSPRRARSIWRDRSSCSHRARTREGTDRYTAATEHAVHWPLVRRSLPTGPGRHTCFFCCCSYLLTSTTLPERTVFIQSLRQFEKRGGPFAPTPSGADRAR